MSAEPSPEPGSFLASVSSVSASSFLTHRSTLQERLARELTARWEEGDRVPVEELLARSPELLDSPEAALELVYEEVCLRQRHGLAVDPAEFHRRFPQWREGLEVLFRCHSLFEGHARPSALPAAGESLGSFHLLAELGRGSAGRVFLASQPALGGRLVVLKVTPRLGREHVSLARLQHTHIVPLYWAEDDRERRLRVLCMPYFGGTSLQALLAVLQRTPVAERNAGHLQAVLAQARAGLPDGTPAPTGALPLLQGGYVEALCRIAVGLAEGLHYAHQRGLVHLDLKPGNVLIAADGQPMLLDFHLAQPPLRPDGPPPEWVGGTPAYMAPEQEEAYAAVRQGRPVPRSVDGRADQYSLGLILHEALSGSPPGRSPGRLSALNPQVSVGLSDVIARCLAADPARRYPDCAALAEDLRRHLSDRPLAGVRNRSLREWVRKWRRRHPQALALGGMFLAILIAAVAVGLVLIDRWGWQRGQARMKSELARAEQAVAQADRARVARELRQVVTRLRLLQGAGTLPEIAARVLECRCAELWQRRGQVVSVLGESASSEWKRDMLEAVLLWTDLRVSLAQDEVTRREVLDVLGEAERRFGTTHALYRQRQVHAKALGLAEVADEAGRAAEAHLPRQAWEHLARGSTLLRTEGGLHEAERDFREARRLDPSGLWPNFYCGVCAYRLERYDDAVTAFSVCIGAAPEVAEVYANRALALAALGKTEALADQAQAERLDRERAGSPAPVYYNLALSRWKKDDRAGARDHLRQALSVDPRHAPSRELLNRLAMP